MNAESSMSHVLPLLATAVYSIARSEAEKNSMECRKLTFTLEGHSDAKATKYYLHISSNHTPSLLWFSQLKVTSSSSEVSDQCEVESKLIHLWYPKEKSKNEMGDIELFIKKAKKIVRNMPGVTDCAE